jgi:hypothetical protein
MNDEIVKFNDGGFHSKKKTFSKFGVFQKFMSYTVFFFRKEKEEKTIVPHEKSFCGKFKKSNLMKLISRRKRGVQNCIGCCVGPIFGLFFPKGCWTPPDVTRNCFVRGGSVRFSCLAKCP